jgi:hypothetical protein
MFTGSCKGKRGDFFEYIKGRWPGAYSKGLPFPLTRRSIKEEKEDVFILGYVWHLHTTPYEWVLREPTDSKEWEIRVERGGKNWSKNFGSTKKHWRWHFKLFPSGAQEEEEQEQEQEEQEEEEQQEQ